MVAWQKIDGYPDYSVSTAGQVRRDTPGRTSRAKLLRPYISRVGYPVVNLSAGGRQKTFYVHHLVAIAFISARPSELHQVAHADGSKTNNSAENLRWVTQSENEMDKLRHGRFVKNPYGRCKLSAEQRVAIFGLKNSGLSQRDIGAIFGVSHTVIGNLLRGKTYAFRAPKQGSYTGFHSLLGERSPGA